MATNAFPNIVSLPGSYSYTSQDLGLDDAANEVEEGADDSDFAALGSDLIVAHNTTVGSIDLVITSGPDAKTGRTASVAQETFAIPAGETHIIGPLAKEGWAVSNKIKMQASAVGLNAAVIRLS